MKFNIFVIPFLAGTLFLVVSLLIIYGQWFLSLNAAERKACRTTLFGKKIVGYLREVISECLLHLRIFKTNRLLGYMHTSLAFGWFLIIIVGHWEATHAMGTSLIRPYYGVFFRYFEPSSISLFTQVMDALLIIVLSGVTLAWIKRLRSKWFGMRKATQHTWGDQLALSALWFIFPLRLLAESITSGLNHNGGFLTASVGNVMIKCGLPTEFELVLWWAYSLSLCAFFVAMPFSRYMHILTEPILILFRISGVEYKGEKSARAQAELHACSRCGICIDACQLSSALQLNTVQPAYFLRSVRYNKLCKEQTDNCLACGRCSESCPVGIDSLPHRLAQRKPLLLATANYDYLPHKIKSEKTDILYFAGCMGQLTPSVTRAMSKLLDASGEHWTFMDKEGSICCGRPQLLAGEKDKATQLREANVKRIRESGAKKLVTSCPICYKMFKETYQLNIEVQHHSQWLQQAVSQKQIELGELDLAVTYHDPCELGRGSKEYEAPRLLLGSFATLLSTANEKGKGLCCGGSLGNTTLRFEQQQRITSHALSSLTSLNPDVVATACPLCKKTFAQVASGVQIVDIAELTLNAYEQRIAQNEEFSVVPEKEKVEWR